MSNIKFTEAQLKFIRLTEKVPITPEQEMIYKKIIDSSETRLYEMKMLHIGCKICKCCKYVSDFCLHNCPFCKSLMYYGKQFLESQRNQWFVGNGDIPLKMVRRCGDNVKVSTNFAVYDEQFVFNSEAILSDEFANLMKFLQDSLDLPGYDEISIVPKISDDIGVSVKTDGRRIKFYHSNEPNDENKKILDVSFDQFKSLIK